MTLKETLIDYLHEPYAYECIDLADDFAIGFGEWLLKFDNLKNENKYIIKQLLQIYKEEKGL
jgi:hypothetical protein